MGAIQTFWLPTSTKLSCKPGWVHIWVSPFWLFVSLKGAFTPGQAVIRLVGIVAKQVVAAPQPLEDGIDSARQCRLIQRKAHGRRQQKRSIECGLIEGLPEVFLLGIEAVLQRAYLRVGGGGLEA